MVQDEYDRAIESADSFDDVVEAIEEHGPVEGSQKTYPRDELKEQVRLVQEKAQHHAVVDPDEREYTSKENEMLFETGNLQYVTNTHGLRDKLIELTENEGNDVDDNYIIHAYGKPD